ncbi:MAG: ribonuclease H-like domain-containing protein [Nanoarchaeota archaeon]|nr:ribonuclease H-like domain-containing protein [Nanoarchaeota archaeon]
MQIRFFPLDAEYKIIGNDPVIYLYGRTREGEVICVMDNSFRPYFFIVPDSDAEEMKKQILALNLEDIKVLGAEVVKKMYLGKEKTLVKVTVQIPAMVPKFKDYMKENDIDYLEADILFVRRYLIDKEIYPTQEYVVEGEEVPAKVRVRCIEAKSITIGEGGYDDPKILAFDIETYPNTARSFDFPILLVAFYGKDYRKIISWKRFETNNKDIEFVNSEADLIRRFEEIVRKQKPDILTGYFSDGFDFPYIVSRARKYKIKLELGLDYSNIQAAKGRSFKYRISGITHLDVFHLTRNILGQFLKTDQYTLDAVSKELLGESKVEVDIVKLADAWDNNDAVMLNKYCEYNLQDSAMTYKLCEKFFPSILELVRMIGVPIYDLNRMAMSQMVEWYLLRNAKKYNIVAPNRPGSHVRAERASKSLIGAFVVKPTPGLYKNIMVFDFRSMYPTIVAAHNISRSTIACDCCRDTAPRVPFEGKEIWFCQKKKGYLPLMIGDLINRRLRIKEIMKEKKSKFLKARSAGLKLLAVSYWGYMAYDNSRWYSFDSAQAILAYERYYIKSVIDKVTEDGYQVIYGDTDSIFLVSETHTIDDAHNIIADINKGLPGIMALEFQDIYPAGIFVSAKGSEAGAKKRYCLIDKNDELVIKGFESIRRNASTITKEVQQKVLAIILKEGNYDKAFKYVREVVDDCRKHNLDLKKFVIKTQLTKSIEEYESVGPHVAIALRMKDRGLPVGARTIIEYVITKDGKKIRDKARELHEVTKDDIDLEYYIFNQIIPAVEKIFEVIGYSKSDLVDEAEQSKLDKFF